MALIWPGEKARIWLFRAHPYLRRLLTITYVVGQPCIDTMDRSCIAICPVDCIYETGRMLVINPNECIDCGACEPECPVDAIVPDTSLPEPWLPFVAINAAIAQGVERVDTLVRARLTS